MHADDRSFPGMSYLLQLMQEIVEVEEQFQQVRSSHEKIQQQIVELKEMQDRYQSETHALPLNDPARIALQQPLQEVELQLAAVDSRHQMLAIEVDYLDVRLKEIKHRMVRLLAQYAIQNLN